MKNKTALISTAVYIFFFCHKFAFGYEAKSQQIDFWLEAPVLEAFQYDTGWWPNQGPVQVRFIVTISGVVQAELHGQVGLSWPPVLSVQYTAGENDGTFSANYGLDVQAKIKLDIPGYQGEVDVPYQPPEDFTLKGMRLFKPYVLEGAQERPVELDLQGSQIDLFNIGFNVLEVADISFHTSVAGNLHCAMFGETLQADNVEIKEEEIWALLDPPDKGVKTITSRFSASFECKLQVVLIPWLEVCPIVGSCLDLVTLEIPFDVQSDKQTAESDAVETEFYFPALSALPEKIDFGDTLLGDQQTVNLEFSNQTLGNELLEVFFLIQPEDSPFSVFPSGFLLPAGAAGGVVLFFQPTQEGEFQAQVQVQTNDPLYSQGSIVLQGRGYVPALEPKTTVEPTDITETDQNLESQEEVWAEVPTPLDVVSHPEPYDVAEIYNSDDVAQVYIPEGAIVGQVRAGEGCGCRIWSSTLPGFPTSLLIVLLALGLIFVCFRVRIGQK